MKVTISVGGRFHAFNLAAELARQGHLRRLITPYPAFAAAKYGVPAEAVTSLLTKEIGERAWRKLPQFVRRRYDPTFFFSEYFDKNAARRIPSDTDLFAGWSSFSLHSIRRMKELGIPTVLDHGSAHIETHKQLLDEERARFGGADTFDPRIVEKELREYEEADHIAVPSLFAMKTFIDKGVPERKLLHVPYGVDLAAFHPGEKTDDVFRVIYVGGMTLQKGVHYLLQAFAEARLPHSELLLVGAMHDEVRPFLEKYGKNVRHVPPVPQAELIKYYAQSSAFVLNSVQDGFGMVIIQAMACGLPVIATTNTGGPDVVRDGEEGFVIPIRDPAALAAKLRWLCDHPEARTKMGAAAAERAAAGFTWHDYGRRMAADYQRILQKS